MKAKWILHHDDPPCEARLESDGFCKVCGFHPDTQSKCLYPYCSKCNVKLINLKCPKCGQEYEKFK